MHLYIQDTDFEKMLKILKGIKGVHTKDVEGLRIFLEAVAYVAREGCRWRGVHPGYGCFRALHKRFFDWCKRNIWGQLFEAAKQDPDLEYVMLDATIVRAHPCAAGYGKDTQKIEALGRSKGGFTTKIHAITDALGNPLNFALTAGQRNEITQAEVLTADFTSSIVIADKGYDSDKFIEWIENRNGQTVIPPRSNRLKPREYDEHLYKERNLIERFFNKIKHWRRIFSRFDKSAIAFLSFCYFVSTLVWFK